MTFGWVGDKIYRSNYDDTHAGHVLLVDGTRHEDHLIVLDNPDSPRGWTAVYRGSSFYGLYKEFAQKMVIEGYLKRVDESRFTWCKHLTAFDDGRISLTLLVGGREAFDYRVTGYYRYPNAWTSHTPRNTAGGQTIESAKANVIEGYRSANQTADVSSSTAEEIKWKQPEPGDWWTAEDVKRALCGLTEEVTEVLGYAHPTACVCADNYNGKDTKAEGFENDGEVIRFIQRAVREKLHAAAQVMECAKQIEDQAESSVQHAAKMKASAWNL